MEKGYHIRRIYSREEIQTATYSNPTKPDRWFVSILLSEIQNLRLYILILMW